MEKLSFLGVWLDRKNPLHVYTKLGTVKPSIEFGCFVSLDVAKPVHEIEDLQAESLEEAWALSRAYVDQAIEIVGMDTPMWLDREEVEWIRDELGEPPPVAYPIYVISVGEGDDERAVYIGKTSSKNARFKGGHSAVNKLHRPEYDGLRKTIYLDTVILLTDDEEGDYLPLEWVQPLSEARDILASIEAQLIFDLKPELNKHHMKRFNSKWATIIHLENHSGASKFLQDETSYGVGGS